MHLTLRGGDGSIENVSASWVIGADGAACTVSRWSPHKPSVLCRRTLCSATSTPSTSWTSTIPTSLPTVRWWCCRAAGGCIPSPGADAPGPRSTRIRHLQAIIDRRIGGIRARLADLLRDPSRRVPASAGAGFLAGDAAHIHSGGQGITPGCRMRSTWPGNWRRWSTAAAAKHSRRPPGRRRRHRVHQSAHQDRHAVRRAAPDPRRVVRMLSPVPCD